MTIQVHVLPREMFGISSFGLAMALLKLFPLSVVDKFLLLMSYFTLGNTEKLGLHRPKTGPMEHKNVTGKTPVLDVGALSKIKSGKIKVNKIDPLLIPFVFFGCVLCPHVIYCYTYRLQLILLGFQVMVGVKEITRNGAKFMDGQEKEFDSIILATGYKSNVPSWLKVNMS